MQGPKISRLFQLWVDLAVRPLFPTLIRDTRSRRFSASFRRQLPPPPNRAKVSNRLKSHG